MARPLVHWHQEYGINRAEKLDIAQAYCVPLMKKIQLDLQRTHEDEAVNKLHPLWECRTPLKRTNMSISHMHTCINKYYKCCVNHLCLFLRPGVQVFSGCHVSWASRPHTPLLHEREPRSLPAQHLPLRRPAECMQWFCHLWLFDFLHVCMCTFRGRIARTELL